MAPNNEIVIEPPNAVRVGHELTRWFGSSSFAPRVLAPARLDAGNHIDWARVMPFLAMHAACLAVIWVGFSWAAFSVTVALYLVRMFAITGFYHRYFSHRTFKTSRVGQFIFGIARRLGGATRSDLVGGSSSPPSCAFGQAGRRAFAGPARILLEPHGLVHVPQALRSRLIAGARI